MSLLVILGDDKLGNLALSQIDIKTGLSVLIDRSSSYRRVLRLVVKGTLSLGLLVKMYFAERKRDGQKPPSIYSGIKGNADLIENLNIINPSKVVLFRAGLILNKEILKKRFPIYNIHAASIPDYGGIGSIGKAIKDRNFKQFASFHEVTTKIDDGKILDSEDFLLAENSSYFENEQVAYSAAIRLLKRRIRILTEN